MPTNGTPGAAVLAAEAELKSVRRQAAHAAYIGKGGNGGARAVRKRASAPFMGDHHDFGPAAAASSCTIDCRNIPQHRSSARSGRSPPPDRWSAAAYSCGCAGGGLDRQERQRRQRRSRRKGSSPPPTHPPSWMAGMLRMSRRTRRRGASAAPGRKHQRRPEMRFAFPTRIRVY